MGKWTIRVDDGQMSALKKYGSCYKHAGNSGGFFEFCGESLQESADNLITILADVFSGSNTKIIEYPEHVIIEEQIYEYANCAEKHIALVIPCKCKEYRHQVGDVIFDNGIRIVLQEQKMGIAEMRKLLDESRAAFSKQYNIPIRTLENWESGRSKCPEYVRQLLERVVKEDSQQ